MSEELKLAFARHYLDVSCNELMWAIRCLQETGFWESQPDTSATLRAIYNSVVGAYHAVDRYIEDKELENKEGQE